VIGSDERSEDEKTARALGREIAKNKWVLLSGGRDSGVMGAVNKGARKAKPPGLTIGILPGDDKSELSSGVDVGIVTGMGSARNNINILSSDVVIACGYGGAGTASEIALALKSKKSVILLNERPTCVKFFVEIGGELVHESKSVGNTISHVKKLLKKSSRSKDR
jgi:uncharacterized protein (TIGR00725 family)